MKKRTIKIGVLLSFVTIATIGTKMADNDKISSFGLMLSNMEALASDSEGGGESGRSICYNGCTQVTGAKYLPCVKCEMEPGQGTSKGGYCKW